MNLKQQLLKNFYPFLLKAGKLVKKNVGVFLKPLNKSRGFYDLTFTSIKGEKLTLVSFSNKKVMIVNTASECGYTAQYGQLNDLAERYPNLIIICFPSNDFKQQEKESNEKIAAFCELNFGNKYLLAQKAIVLKKVGQHPIYKWLCDASKNGWNEKAPTWNFCKYLLDESGNLIGFFEAGIEPGNLQITTLL